MGCAASVRGELNNLAGVANIQTDVESMTCKFTVTDSNLDIKSKLDELAKSNEHIAGFQIMSN